MANAGAKKTLYVCENTMKTRDAFAREFGHVEFVTAEQAVAKDAAWAAPRCITATEARKLNQLARR